MRGRSPPFPRRRREVERSCELGADGVEVIAVHPQWPAPGGIRPSAEVAEDRHAQWGIFIDRRGRRGLLERNVEADVAGADWVGHVSERCGGQSLGGK